MYGGMIDIKMFISDLISIVGHVVYALPAPPMTPRYQFGHVCISLCLKLDTKYWKVV